METVDIKGHRFPLYTARPGDEDASLATWRGRPMQQRAANNILWLVEPRQALPGWRLVGGRPRWTWFDGWVRNDAGMMLRGQRRWWGRRQHIRIWHRDGHAVGQAHDEIWQGTLPRRHHVTSLDAGRDAVVEAAKAAGYSVSFFHVPSQGRGWDGRVAVIE